MSVEKDLKEMENIPREDYIKIYNLIGKNMWKYCEIPTVGDILKGFNSEESQLFDDITSFLDNKDSLIERLDKTDSDYSSQESKEFINSVISSNVTDISDAGWFYKKLMASTDDIRIKMEDCGSKGKEYFIGDITEDLYDYRIRYSWIEYGDQAGYSTQPYKDFIQIKNEGYDSIFVRSPLTCNAEDNHRSLCERCAGVIKRSHTEEFIPKNFGLWTTLMVTEHATQASLDTMNKGESENVNDILDKKMPSKRMKWEEVEKEINDITESIGNVGVQARFYEVALLSRFYKQDNGLYAVSSLQHSFTNQDDPLGTFIYSKSWKNFIKLLEAGEFEASSIKSQIMFDIYDE